MKLALAVAGKSCLIGPIIFCAYAENGQVNFDEIKLKELDKSNMFQSLIKGFTKVLQLEWKRKITKILVDDIMGPVTNVSVKQSNFSPEEWELLVKAQQKVDECHSKIIHEYSDRFPEWKFDENHGEPTKEHKVRIRRLKEGTPVHRRSFDPMRRFVHPIGQTRDNGCIVDKSKHK